jgi:glycosyltransferase involved in cell wall biosynthesis
MNKPLVTIITPTTGTIYLKQCIESVNAQSYQNIEHLVVVDGPHNSACDILKEYQMMPKVKILKLPFATGKDKYNGHRIYGGCTFFMNGDYVIFLDEDNWLEPNHVQSLVDSIGQNKWAYSLRKITDMEGKYICNDDCESLGNWKSILNDNFVDVNCYMLHKSLALNFAPGWYRRARHPQEQPEVDRLLSWWLKENKFEANCTGEYTVNYRAGNREDSVKPEFFIRGNEIMREGYGGDFPWRKKI